MKKLTSILAVSFTCVALFAQQTNYNTATASILKIKHSNAELNAMRTFTPPVAHPAYGHSSAYKAGVALLVLGPVKMAVGLGVAGWTIRAIDRENREGIDPGNGVAFGAALATFHILTGAGLTAGGAVLLHKGKRESAHNIYLTVPEMTMQANQRTGNGLGMRTAVIF